MIKKLTVNIPMMLAINTDKEPTENDVKNIIETVVIMLRDGFFDNNSVFDAARREDKIQLEDFTFGEGETMEWVDKHNAKEAQNG